MGRKNNEVERYNIKNLIVKKKRKLKIKLHESVGNFKDLGKTLMSLKLPYISVDRNKNTFSAGKAISITLNKY